MNFMSDNTTGVSPEIMAAMVAANDGHAMPYGDDETTIRLAGLFGDLFETEVAVYPVLPRRAPLRPLGVRKACGRWRRWQPLRPPA